MRLWIPISLALALSVPAAGRAQVSLWDGRSPGGDANLLRPVKARDFKINDIIHIIVSVSAEATTDEEVELEKKSNKNSLAINQYIKLKQNGLLFDLKGYKPEDLALDMTADKQFEGEGTADRKDTLRTRLAAAIVDIKPNGNLVIEAKSRFTKNRETTTITLAGVVRPQDVAPDNSVYSYNVADADITYQSRGPISDANRRGWLLRIIDRVWPF